MATVRGGRQVLVFQWVGRLEGGATLYACILCKLVEFGVVGVVCSENSVSGGRRGSGQRAVLHTSITICLSGKIFWLVIDRGRW